MPSIWDTLSGHAPQLQDNTGVVSDADARAQAALRAQEAKYNPYITAGQGALPILQGQYAQLLNNPQALYNKWASSYQESPYAKYQTQAMTGALNRNAAATGSLGSPYAQQNLASTIHGITSGDEQQYINQMRGLYSQGLSGEQGMAHMGLQGLGGQSGLVSQGAGLDMQSALAQMSEKDKMQLQQYLENQQGHQNLLQNIGAGAGLLSDLPWGKIGGWLSGLL